MILALFSMIGSIATKSFSISYWIEGVEPNGLSKIQIGSIASGTKGHWEWSEIQNDIKPQFAASTLEDSNSLLRVSVGESLKASIPVQAFKETKPCQMQLNLMVEDDNQTVSHSSLSITDDQTSCESPIRLSIKKKSLLYGPQLLKPISIQDTKADGSAQSLLVKYWYYILPLAIFFLVTTPAE